MRKLTLAALATLALATAACGGSDKTTTAATDGGATTPAATTPVATTGAAGGATDTCKQVDAPPPSTKQYASPPAPPFDTQGAKLVMTTSCGTITFTLDKTLGGPVTDAVAGLAADHFYDNLTFHRVVPDFVLQGGDPAGTGGGGPGFSTVMAPPAGFVYKKGDLAMAKTGAEPAGTAGSQFFVVSSDAGGQQLTPDYAIIGHTTDPASLATIDRVNALGVSDGPPSQTVIIESATVTR
jgi:peptidyl-prolyl cis-trans isomerase B (cyclophilin B)